MQDTKKKAQRVSKNAINQGISKPSKGGFLDTSEQVGTKPKKQHNQCSCSSCGNEDDFKLNQSTNSNNSNILQKRSKRKHQSESLAMSIISLLDEERDTITENSIDDWEAYNRVQGDLKSFWNMWKCARTLEKKGDKVTTRYCKNRLCLVCSAIRQAQGMERHKPILKDWGDSAYFVTLTKKTVKEEDLKEAVNFLVDTLKKIKARMKKQYQRKQIDKLQVISKLECTYNPKTKEYHPHFHLIIKGKENAHSVKEYWLGYVKEAGYKANDRGQDIRKCDDNVLKELFKYITKITSSSSKSNTKKLIYPKALLAIFRAFKHKRTFEVHGFKLPKLEVEKMDDEAKEVVIVEGVEEGGELAPSDTVEYFEWSKSQCDWVSITTGSFIAWEYKDLKEKDKALEILEELDKKIVRSSSS